MSVSSSGSCLQMTGVSTAELWGHLPNINAISSYPLFVYTQTTSKITDRLKSVRWLPPLFCSSYESYFSATFHMMTSSNGNIFRVTGPLCGEFTGPGEFPTQRPVTRSFDVFLDLRLNKRLSKQPRGWWFKTQSWSLWRHCNEVQ